MVMGMFAVLYVPPRVISMVHILVFDAVSFIANWPWWVITCHDEMLNSFSLTDKKLTKSVPIILNPPQQSLYLHPKSIIL